MERKIVGYHLDEENHWVAELDCYHNQHVRHDPPLTNRPWVLTENGRKSRLNLPLNCIRCDNLEFPDNLTPYRKTAIFDKAFLQRLGPTSYTTKVGSWGLIHVLEGVLIYTIEHPVSQRHKITRDKKGVIPPDTSYNITTTENVQFYVEFFLKLPIR